MRASPREILLLCVTVALAARGAVAQAAPHLLDEKCLLARAAKGRAAGDADRAADRASARRRQAAEALEEAATVADAARLMTDKREHRAWILNADETPIGVLTCTDVLRCVATAVRTPAPTPAAVVDQPRELRSQAKAPKDAPL